MVEERETHIQKIGLALLETISQEVANAETEALGRLYDDARRVLNENGVLEQEPDGGWRRFVRARLNVDPGVGNTGSLYLQASAKVSNPDEKVGFHPIDLEFGPHRQPVWFIARLDPWREKIGLTPKLIHTSYPSGPIALLKEFLEVLDREQG